MEPVTSQNIEKSDRAARRRFQWALGLFVLWVIALGVMAVVSGRRPAASPTGIQER